MKLFTKDIDRRLFAQYPKGADLESQMVIAKIFNPYGRGTWYILNSDPQDPDYLWAIVDLFDVEVGSVSRSELENIKVPPFRLNLERDLSFTPVNAAELYRGLLSGKMYANGGSIESKKDEQLNSIYPEVKRLFTKHGLNLDSNYGFTDGSNVSYVPYFSLKRTGDKLDKVVVTYYGDGFEALGEIEIEIEDEIEIEVNFPYWGIHEEIEKYADGGMTPTEESRRMLLNQAEGFEHHADELEKAAREAKHIPAWVVAKSQRATTDLSDITHYLDGENEQSMEAKMAEGGEIMKHKYYGYITIELIEPTNKGWKVKQIETHTSSGKKLAKPKETIQYYRKDELRDLFDKIMANGGQTGRFNFSVGDVFHNWDTPNILMKIVDITPQDYVKVVAIDDESGRIYTYDTNDAYMWFDSGRWVKKSGYMARGGSMSKADESLFEITEAERIEASKNTLKLKL
jgi:hypothetical protein